MPDAVLMFTFSPVQPFIAEARRTADLYAGSAILVELARAAGEALKRDGARLVFPAELSDDVPNKLVALCADPRTAAEVARQALLDRWQQIAEDARRHLLWLGAEHDDVWNTIWQRQAQNPWEVYWAATTLVDGAAGAYRDAYREAARALDGAKRTRVFAQAEELGEKDSLSGRREALHTGAALARDYWAGVAKLPTITGAQLRAEGRERLDAIGAIKRFGARARSGQFPSTSTVAAAAYLTQAKLKAEGQLASYRRQVEALLGDRVRSLTGNAAWPYDGDLLYEATLTPERLADGHGATNLDAMALRQAQQALRSLHAAAGRPSPYYAMVALDGDGMGKLVSACLDMNEPEQEHRAFSERLSSFAARVRPVSERHHATVVYNGGDDVLLLAPAEQALPAAAQLAAAFAQDTGATASAGIALAHHLSPLDTALREARTAEARAKRVEGKAAVCVRVLRRGGEVSEARTRWAGLAEGVAELVTLFRGDANGAPLSPRFAYEVAATARSLPDLDGAFASDLRRLLKRHRNDTHRSAPDPAVLAERLCAWAATMPTRDAAVGTARAVAVASTAIPAPGAVGAAPGSPQAAAERAGSQSEALAGWLGLAAFLARGGDE